MSPYKPMKPCGHRGCPGLTYSRYCDEHEKQYEREYNQRRGNSTRRGYGVHHRKLRKIILSEEPICRTCKKAPSTEMDHIDGDNTNLSRDNLQGSCKSCHSTKTVKEQKGWGKSNVQGL